jgi:hypothetical protein
VRKTALAEETRLARENADISGAMKELSKMRICEKQVLPFGIATSDSSNK